jgi:hypothetical protein
MKINSFNDDNRLSSFLYDLFLSYVYNNWIILFHNSSGISYSDSTPVSLNITKIIDRLVWLILCKHSMPKNQQISINVRIGTYLQTRHIDFIVTTKNVTFALDYSRLLRITTALDDQVES